MSLLSLLSELAGQLAPEPCLRCRAPCRHGFCADCLAEFPRIRNACRCGLPRPCHRCPADDAGWIVATVHTPFEYAGVPADCIQALKYRGRRRIGAALGHALADEYSALANQWDRIVPVPLHSQRLRQRTFNQASEIAMPMASRLQTRLISSGVKRRLKAAPQAGQTRLQRLHNLGNAFAIRRSFAGQRVLIVDDVITTGATVNALAAALLSSGAGRVDACAVARATIEPRGLSGFSQS